MNRTYNVKIDAFEGPLDLLLHLINELEIDIYDIPVAKITEQYMNYIQSMKEIELNIASEYLVMAATLLAIKSEMLLPKKEISYDDEYEEDPRDELIKRLIEYRKYKEAAADLKEKELAENEIFTRTPMQFKELSVRPPVVRGDVSIDDMLNALEKVFIRRKWNEPLETTINRMEVSIEQKMNEVLSLIQSTNGKVQFDQLFIYSNRTHIVTTFLAILQLMKENQINCLQNSHFQTIYVYAVEDQ